MAKDKPKSRKDKQSKKWKLYDVSGGLKRKNKICPKCGDGVFLARHKDRDSCGKCGYTEFRKGENNRNRPSGQPEE